jgi:hypothetical protein
MNNIVGKIESDDGTYFFGPLGGQNDWIVHLHAPYLPKLKGRFEGRPIPFEYDKGILTVGNEQYSKISGGNTWYRHRI